MKKARIALLLLLLAIVLTPVVANIIPVPDLDSAKLPAGTNFKSVLTFVLFLMWLYVGAAVLFNLGLDVFKQKLRRAYRPICAGLAVLGVALVQSPVIILLDLVDSAWVENGGQSFPAVVAWLLIFIGLCRFAKALGDTSWVTMPKKVLPILGVITIITILLAPLLAAAEYSHWAAVANGMVLQLVLVCTVVAFRIKRVAGAAYTNALAWLVMPMLFTALGLVSATLLQVLSLTYSPLYDLPFVLAAILFMKAGYAFNKIREY